VLLQRWRCGAVAARHCCATVAMALLHSIAALFSGSIG
jgi:hypothetical protein